MALRNSCVWLWRLSLGGVHGVLKRLGLSWKRGRSTVRSPDPDYHAKQDAIAQAVAEAEAPGSQVVTVYLDEVTIARQPSVSQDYQARGPAQPRARRCWAADSQTRLLAALEHSTGRVVAQRGRVTVAALVRFFSKLRQAYPQASVIKVVLDNWPVHWHADLLVALVAQSTPWVGRLPANWSSQPSAEALRKWGELHLPIQFVPLPTYASWLNPIEKLWRKLRQEVTHHHPWADDLPRLREELDRFLAQYESGSADLLRYVGLGIPD